MNWKLIQKDVARKPQKGTYQDWKQQIAEEGYNQCVYCAIHESAMGGIRNFHVEHYHPKSLFKEEENDYLNLFYACPICNTFKSNDWPGEPDKDNSVAAYPNPSQVDYSTLFDIDVSRGLIKGKNVAATYIQEKLFLNRPQLIILRRRDFLTQIAKIKVDEIRKTLESVKDNDLYRKYSEILIDLCIEFHTLLLKLNEIPHYKMEDVKRD